MQGLKEDDFYNSIIDKRKAIMSLIYNFVFFFTLLLITLISFKRIHVFAKMYDSFESGFQIFGLEFYFISLFLILIIDISLLSYILYFEIKNKEWLDNLKKITSKLDIFKFIFQCFSILLFIMVFFFNPCTISGDSMNPTFKNNQRIICTDFLYEPKKGDVITFDASDYNTPNKAIYIKRIVAVEGDIINFDANMFLVNGKYEKRQGVTIYEFNNIVNGLEKKDYNGIVGYKIPKNELVVLGDNRENSYDSGEFTNKDNRGTIYKKDIFGKVVFRLNPFKIY